MTDKKIKKVELTLGCILRDEGSYVAEWLTFHHLVGFDRFVCVLHQCVDDTEEQINLVKEKLGLDIRVHHVKVAQGKVQMSTYDWIIKQYGQYTEWMLFLDGDEYVHCVYPSHEYQNDIKDYLSTFKSASAISCNAKVFGANNHIAKPPYRLSAYTARLPQHHLSSNAVKTFFKPDKFVKVASPHFQVVKGQHIMFDGSSVTMLDSWRASRRQPLWEPICYNHYYTGSIEDWIERYHRGSCNDRRPAQAYSVDEFLYHSENMEYDDVILGYQGWHKALMEQLQQ